MSGSDKLFVSKNVSKLNFTVVDGHHQNHWGVMRMNLSQKQKDALVSIPEYEQKHGPKKGSLRWSWSDVRVALPALNSLEQQ